MFFLICVSYRDHISQVCKEPSRLNFSLNRKHSFTLEREIVIDIDPQGTQEYVKEKGQFVKMTRNVDE